MTTNSITAGNTDYSTYVVPGKSTQDDDPISKIKADLRRDTAEISDLAKGLATGNEWDNVATAKTAEQAKYATRMDREAEGTRLDAYLNELREKYGEEEAMNKFHAYMVSEGYEIDYSALRPGIGQRTKEKIYAAFSSYRTLGVPKIFLSKSVNPETGLGFSSAGTGFMYMTTDRASDNFVLTSSIRSIRENGVTTYQTETYAQYDASVGKDISDVVEEWKNRNVTELSQEAGFDVGEYLEKFGETGFLWGKSFAAESLNTDLAGIVNSILEKAGVQLGASQSLSLIFDEDQRGIIGLNVHLNFGDASMREKVQSEINKAVANNPSVLQAFKVEDASVDKYDVSTLDGAFTNGIQSNFYVQHRMFLLSGDQPSTMVMGSGLDNVTTGYIYKKKVSDSFDPSADVMTFSGTAKTVDDWHEQRAITQQMIDDVRKNM